MARLTDEDGVDAIWERRMRKLPKSTPREPTLNEALAVRGWTSGPGSNAIGQGKNVYDEDGALIGQMTAGETWEYLNKIDHEAGDLCTAEDCTDCSRYRRGAKRRGEELLGIRDHRAEVLAFIGKEGK